MKSPTPAEIEARLRGQDLNSWLDLWHTEQGPAKPSALRLLASAIPFPPGQPLRVLDLGCGPGDAGRAVHARFPLAHLDSIDRNQFFVALCAAVNRRDGVPGQTLLRDLSRPNWRRGLDAGYDVALAVNSLHWLSLPEATRLFADLFLLLRSGGVFLLMEPAAVEPLFAAGFEAWQKQQPGQHNHENWIRFWTRVRDLVGCDYGFLAPPPEGGDRIGDTLSVNQWIRLLTNAGFASIDVLLRDPEKVVLTALRP